jgi:hypothetical protein
MPLEFSIEVEKVLQVILTHSYPRVNYRYLQVLMETTNLLIMVSASFSFDHNKAFSGVFDGI